MCKNVFCWELYPQYAVDRHARRTNYRQFKNIVSFGVHLNEGFTSNIYRSLMFKMCENVFNVKLYP